MPTSSILVTGALGNVGAEVVKLLRQSGRPVHAAGTRPAAIAQRFGSQVEATWLDFEKPESFGAALAGVERMFLMRPPAISNVRRYIFPVIDAAKQAGVRQIVFLSLIGVEKNRVVPHYKIEQHILKSGLEYTFLRPSFFMQNLSTTHRDEIKDQNEIFVPAGRGKTSFIDARDIAAVATLTLTEAGHANQIYELTGDEALDYGQVAALLTDVLGRSITYRHPSLLQFMRRQHAKGTPLAFAAVMAGIYTTARLGLAARLTGDLRRLLGRAPISFKQYVEDYQACWQPTTR
ncbi:MAG: SDR family oxidoreductase [Chloroflexota bacterium]|nr:SDR family oxidoreductase [Chloroflexota bacterium]